MEEINDLKERTKHLENVRLVKIEEDIGEMKTDLAENSLLTRQSVETNKELSATLRNVSDTMIKISGKLDNNNDQVKDLGDKFDCFETKVDQRFEDTDNKIKTIEEEADRIDEKTKFDWSNLVKNRLIPSLLGGGIIYGIVEIIKEFT